MVLATCTSVAVKLDRALTAPIQTPSQSGKKTASVMPRTARVRMAFRQIIRADQFSFTEPECENVQ